VYVYIISLVLRSRSYHAVEPMGAGAHGAQADDPTALCTAVCTFGKD
jgi:hypothetical protein